MFLCQNSCKEKYQQQSRTCPSQLGWVLTGFVEISLFPGITLNRRSCARCEGCSRLVHSSQQIRERAQMEPGLLFCEEGGPVLSPVPLHDAPATQTHGGGGCFVSTEGPSQYGCGNLAEVPSPPPSLFSHSCAASGSSSTKPTEPAPSVASCCRDWMTMPFEFAISSQHKGHEEEGSEHSVKLWDEDRKKSCEDWIGQVYLFVNVHNLIRVYFTSLHGYCLRCRVTACTVAAPKQL